MKKQIRTQAQRTNGDTLSEKQRHILNFMADDLIKIFWDKE